MPRFVILMREDDHAWSRLPRDEQKTLLARYHAWVDRLREQGILHAGEPLGSGARWLRMVSGSIHEEPCTTTRQSLTGFFIIEAQDLDEAARIARDCPALKHGETVEVREVGHV